MTTHGQKHLERGGSGYIRKKVGVVAPSEAQLFGPLSIYNNQQKSTRLAHDLSKAFSDEKRQIACNLLLVLRDGCTENESFPGSRHLRFYHPSFLARRTFVNEAIENHCLKSLFVEGVPNSGEVLADLASCESKWRTDNQSRWHRVLPLFSGIRAQLSEQPGSPVRCRAWEWILLFCADDGVGLAHHISTLPGGGADTSYWKEFVTEAEESTSAWQLWEQQQTAQDAFEKLVSAFSRLKYAGATPSGLDEILYRKNAKRPIYPIVCIKESKSIRGGKSWIKGVWSDLYSSSPEPMPLSPAKEKNELSIADTIFPYAKENEEDKLTSLFFDFLDPFFVGKNVLSPEYEAGFQGLALPLFDRWEYDGPAGAFVGWLFLYFPDGGLPASAVVNADKNSDEGMKTTGEKNRDWLFERLCAGVCSKVESNNGRNVGACRDACNADRISCREILRANLNDYAESLAESTLGEEIHRYDPESNGDPAKRFRRRFHYVEGWSVKSMGKRFLEEGSFSKAEREGETTILTVRLDGICAVLEKKWDTVWCEHEEYRHRIAGWARSFWQGLSQVYDARQRGRASGWEEHLEGMSHEARRLIRRINKSERGYVLDIIRQYLHTLLFSDSLSDNVRHGKLTSERVRLQVGRPFAEEIHLSDFVLAMLRQAAAIEYLSDYDLRTAPLFSRRFNHHVASVVRQSLLEGCAHDISAEYSNVFYSKKVLFGCALVCAIRNVLKHQDPNRPQITICLDVENARLLIKNYGSVTTNSVGVATYGTILGGTYGAVLRYVRQYVEVPDEAPDMLIMPGSPAFIQDANGCFTSVLPLPKDFICRMSS